MTDNTSQQFNRIVDSTGIPLSDSAVRASDTPRVVSDTEGLPSDSRRPLSDTERRRSDFDSARQSMLRAFGDLAESEPGEAAAELSITIGTLVQVLQVRGMASHG